MQRHSSPAETGPAEPGAVESDGASLDILSLFNYAGQPFAHSDRVSGQKGADAFLRHIALRPPYPRKPGRQSKRKFDIIDDSIR